MMRPRVGLRLAPPHQALADLSNSFSSWGFAGRRESPAPCNLRAACSSHLRGQIPSPERRIRTCTLQLQITRHNASGVTPSMSPPEWRLSLPDPSMTLVSSPVIPTFMSRPAGLVCGERRSSASSSGVRPLPSSNRKPSPHAKNCSDPLVAPKNPSLLVPHLRRCYLPATDPPTGPSLPFSVLPSG